MANSSPDKTTVVTVSNGEDEFSRLFPMAVQYPVWQVARISTLLTAREQSRRERLQILTSEIGIDLLSKIRFIPGARANATSDATNSGSWAAAAVIESDKTSDQPVGSIDLSNLDPQDFIHAIHQALASSNHGRARRLANQAVELYPEHEELTKMAHILARPTVVKRKVEADTSIRANQKWLTQNFDVYKGKWVALRNGELVEIADTAGELKARINDFTGMMVTRV